MRYRELTRKLRRLGCEFDRPGKGDHEVWLHLQSRKRAFFPNWGSRDLKTGTIVAILKDLGISREDSTESE